ncbi:hypothetical protein [Modicisalibacter coralii]|uniref:hypothetical protein n=1 Tax=Modicisalibacter coralii TaxID=2304602 RepID=UPI00100A990F|nr:hypothetical protein [Halomonas coralii]
MDDKELLEKAARAAGIDGKYHVVWRGVGRTDEYGCFEVWNPLADDGDAFRLLHDMKLDTHRGENELGEPIITVVGDMSFNACPICDEYDITGFRRAIVRAAAAMAEEDT